MNILKDRITVLVKILDDPPESLIFPPALRFLKHALTCSNDLTSPSTDSDVSAAAASSSTKPSASISGESQDSKENGYSTNDVKDSDFSSQFAHRTMVESHDSDDILNGKNIAFHIIFLHIIASQIAINVPSIFLHVHCQKI